MIGQLGWTNFPSYISNLPFLLISLSHSPPTFSSATGFVRCSVGGKRIIILHSIIFACKLLRCLKMNFWISNLLVQFSVFMASIAKEIYLVMDWRKATPLVTNRTLVVRFHDHFFYSWISRLLEILFFLQPDQAYGSPLLQQLTKASPLLFYRHSSTFI